MPHRLFVALRPPPAVRDALIDLMEGERDIRWQDDDQLHLTLRYIGEVDRHDADAIAAALGRIVFAPFPVSLTGTGTFARKGKVHTLYAGVTPSAALAALQSKIERTCVRAGLEPEQRKFAPHVTIARLNRSSGDLRSFLGHTAGFAAGPWACDAFHLYESHLAPGGPLYERAASFPATSAA